MRHFLQLYHLDPRFCFLQSSRPRELRFDKWPAHHKRPKIVRIGWNKREVCLTDLSMKLKSKGPQKHEWWWRIYLWEDISPHDICNQWFPAICHISQNSFCKILDAEHTAACRRYKHHSNPWHPPDNSKFMNMSIHNHTMNCISETTQRMIPIIYHQRLG